MICFTYLNHDRSTVHVQDLNGLCFENFVQIVANSYMSHQLLGLFALVIDVSGRERGAPTIELLSIPCSVCLVTAMILYIFFKVLTLYFDAAPQLYAWYLPALYLVVDPTPAHPQQITDLLDGEQLQAPLVHRL
jgi:hypothetical protein